MWNLHLSLGVVSPLCDRIRDPVQPQGLVSVWLNRASRGLGEAGLCLLSPLGSTEAERVGRKVLRSSFEASNWSDHFEILGAEAKKEEERTGKQRNRLEADRPTDSGLCHEASSQLESGAARGPAGPGLAMGTATQK